MGMTKIPTEKQNTIINDKCGLFTVRACPGSGKTFTVAGRMLRFLTSWKQSHQGIAVISFTNVAWQEINGYLTNDFGLHGGPAYPHFLGTIDSFINKYIFLPFGHLVMHCATRPVLTGPPHDDHEPIGSWLWWGNRNCNKNQCQLNDFTYDIRGIVSHIRYSCRGEHCAANPQRPCIQHKHTFSRKGYATQTDANYYAYKILTEYPSIAKSIAIRFPMLMVDEAQDTSSTQMAILDALIANGLAELMLVGDPDQSIYEWRDAEPNLFIEKCNSWNNNSIELDENLRSSRSICQFASHLSSSSNSIQAANPNVCDCRTEVQIWTYPNTNELPMILQRFIEHCHQEEVNEECIAILTRSAELLNSISPGTSPRNDIYPWKDSLSRGLAQGRYLLERGEYRDAFKVVEREVAKRIVNKNMPSSVILETILKHISFSEWRACLFHLLRSLPTTDLILSDWAKQANLILTTTRGLDKVSVQIKKNSGKCRYGELHFDDIFGDYGSGYDERNGPYFGTVHSVKGRTFDGIMIVLKKKAGQSGNYTNILNMDIIQNEELRILYVAITRPRRLLIVVVPQEDEKQWKQHFYLIDNA